MSHVLLCHHSLTNHSLLPPTLFAHSGYIDAGLPPSGKGKMYFHYFMVESESDPANDPVLIWYELVVRSAC